MCPSTREVTCAERRHGTGPHVGQAGGVDHGLRHARSRIVEREQPVLRREAAVIVVDVVPDDLDAGQRERRDVAAQHVEVTTECLVRPQVDARLDHGLAVALGAQAGLDGAQDLVVRQREGLDVGPVEVGEVEIAAQPASAPR
jgi:hypothetical protein